MLQIASQQCVDQRWVDEDDVREFESDDAENRRAVVRLPLQAAVHQHLLLVAVTADAVWVTDVVQLSWLLRYSSAELVVDVLHGLVAHTNSSTHHADEALVLVFQLH